MFPGTQHPTPISFDYDRDCCRDAHACAGYTEGRGSTPYVGWDSGPGPLSQTPRTPRFMGPLLSDKNILEFLPKSVANMLFCDVYIEGEIFSTVFFFTGQFRSEESAMILTCVDEWVALLTTPEAESRAWSQQYRLLVT